MITGGCPDFSVRKIRVHQTSHRALSGGVQKPVIAQPLQNGVVILFANYVILYLLDWAGLLMTGLDTPIKGPSNFNGGVGLKCTLLVQKRQPARHAPGNNIND